MNEHTRLDYGQTPPPPKQAPAVVRWLFIAFMCAVGVAALFVLYLIYYARSLGPIGS